MKKELKLSDLKDIEIDEDSLFDLQHMLTPLWILNEKEFPEPKVINGDDSSFDFLLANKEEIKNLRLVPVKDDVTHKFYNSINRDLLASEISEKLKKSDIFLLENEYPYWLPADLKQFIIWVQTDLAPVEVLRFIAKVSKFLKVDYKDLILFERPMRTKSKLVKGTIPHFRHIHFWIKNS